MWTFLSVCVGQYLNTMYKQTERHARGRLSSTCCGRHDRQRDPWWWGRDRRQNATLFQRTKQTFYSLPLNSAEGPFYTIFLQLHHYFIISSCKYTISCVFVWAAVTKYLRLSGSSTAEIYSSQAWGWGSETRGQRGGVLVRVLALAAAADFSLCSHVAGRGEELRGVLFTRALIPFMRAP